MGSLCSRSFLLVGFVKTSIYPFFLIKKGGVLEYRYKRKKASPRRFLKGEAGLGIGEPSREKLQAPPTAKDASPPTKAVRLPLLKSGRLGKASPDRHKRAPASHSHTAVRFVFEIKKQKPADKWKRQVAAACLLGILEGSGSLLCP